MTLRCHAKINTFLAVAPPDARGWHPLRTIFQEIDLADEITVLPHLEGRHDVVTFSIEGVPEENTVTKVLHVLREQGEEIPPQRIHVEKRIPLEAGLGGGSSDAAGIIRHFGAQMDFDARWNAARAIGADVPFFLFGGRAKGEGYGEDLTLLPDLPARWLVLARPDEGCSTPEMFRRLDAMPRELLDFPAEDVLYNDFERVAPRASLDLVERLLVHGAADASLTGSGSVVFGRFHDRAAAERAAEKMGGDAPWVRLSRTRRSAREILS